MKKILLIFIMALSLYSFTCEKDKKSPLLNEIEWFIDTVGVNSSDYMNQFTVFVLYAYKTDSMQEKLCYSIGYILEAEYFSELVYPMYYLNIDNNVVVVSLGANVTKDEILGLDLKSLELKQTIKIAQKLYPKLPLGGFTGVSLGITCCSENNIFNRTIYKDRDRMPKDISIFRTR